MRRAGPLGYAFPTDQPTAVTAVSSTQHGHRVQPMLLTVPAATAAATGHRVSDFVDVIILRLHPVKWKFSDIRCYNIILLHIDIEEERNDDYDGGFKFVFHR